LRTLRIGWIGVVALVIAACSGSAGTPSTGSAAPAGRTPVAVGTPDGDATAGAGGTPPAVPTPPASPAPIPGDRNPEALVAKGHVTDSAGNPLGGVAVTADFQLTEDFGLDGTTDANGDYRIELDPPISSWHMSAQLTTTYHGIEYSFALHPLDDSPFVGQEGGVRDFVWRLTGPTVHPEFTYGGTVIVYADFAGGDILTEFVELTLTPDGPLVDGSAGAAITASGDAIQDVAVGRYTISARYLEPGKPPVPLLVRVRGAAGYAPTTTADFEQVSSSGQEIELEVRRSD
jgi:hypothetical protein